MSAILLALLALAGCTPTLDWREVRPDRTAVVVTFPCRPSSHARKVTLGGRITEFRLHACEAAGRTWGLASADVGDAGAVGAVLRELAAAARSNAGAVEAVTRAAAVPGATPNTESRRLVLRGRRLDGEPLEMHLVVFAHGTRVFQGTVLGRGGDAEPVETFLGSLRIRS